MRYPERLTIPIELYRDAGKPLRDQIVDQVAAAIAAGALAPGARIPSTRGLAEILGVSRGVAAEAYTELETRGLVRTRNGSGTFIAGGPDPGAADANPAPEGKEPAGNDQSVDVAIDLRPWSTQQMVFPLEQWRAAWRQASHRPPVPSDGAPLGLPQLRRALADHLVATRGLPPAGQTVVVTAGIRHGLELASQLLGTHRATVALEQPTSPELAGAVRDSCSAAVPLPADTHGAYFGAVPSGCIAAILCPDGTVPYGYRLTARRRQQALEWAAANDAALIEVADGRIIRPAAPAVGAAVPSLLIGDLSRLISPALGVGFLTLPEQFARRAAQLIAERGGQPSPVAQLACTQLLTSGAVRQHMQRLERDLTARRAMVIRELSRLRPGVRLLGTEALDTLVVGLPQGADAAAIATTLHHAGVRLDTLDSCYLPASVGAPGLVLGYGNVPEDVLYRGLRRMIRTLGNLSRAGTARRSARSGPGRWRGGDVRIGEPVALRGRV